MSHALHRHGTTEQLQNDYTFYARASRYVNRDGCGPKLRKILSIALTENEPRQLRLQPGRKEL